MVGTFALIQLGVFLILDWFFLGNVIMAGACDMPCWVNCSAIGFPSLHTTASSIWTFSLRGLLTWGLLGLLAMICLATLVCGWFLGFRSHVLCPTMSTGHGDFMPALSCDWCSVPLPGMNLSLFCAVPLCVYTLWGVGYNGSRNAFSFRVTPAAWTSHWPCRLSFALSRLLGAVRRACLACGLCLGLCVFASYGRDLVGLASFTSALPCRLRALPLRDKRFLFGCAASSGVFAPRVVRWLRSRFGRVCQDVKGPWTFHPPCGCLSCAPAWLVVVAVHALWFVSYPDLGFGVGVTRSEDLVASDSLTPALPFRPRPVLLGDDGVPVLSISMLCTFVLWTFRGVCACKRSACQPLQRAWASSSWSGFLFFTLVWPLATVGLALLACRLYPHFGVRFLPALWTGSVYALAFWDCGSGKVCKRVCAARRVRLSRVVRPRAGWRRRLRARSAYVNRVLRMQQVLQRRQHTASKLRTMWTRLGRRLCACCLVQHVKGWSMRPHHQTSQKETWASIKQQSMYRGGGGGTESHAKAKVERQLLTGLQELLTKIGADRSASQVTPSQQLSKKARKGLRKQDRSLLSALSALVERATKGNSDVPLLDRLRGLVAAAEQGLVGEWNPDGRGLAKNAPTTARVSQAPQAQVSKAKGLEKGKGVKRMVRVLVKKLAKEKVRVSRKVKACRNMNMLPTQNGGRLPGGNCRSPTGPTKLFLLVVRTNLRKSSKKRLLIGSSSPLPTRRKKPRKSSTSVSPTTSSRSCFSSREMLSRSQSWFCPELQPLIRVLAAVSTRARHNGRVATRTCWAYRLHAEAPALKFSVVVKGDAHPTVGALVKKPPGVLKDDKKATTVVLRFQLDKRYVSADTWKQCLAKAGEQARLWAHSSGPHMAQVCQDTFHFSVVGNNLIQGLMRVKIGDHADELIAKSGQMHNNMRWFVEPMSWQQCKLSSERPDVKWVEIADRESAQAYAQRVCTLSTGLGLVRGWVQLGLRRKLQAGEAQASKSSPVEG